MIYRLLLRAFVPCLLLMAMPMLSHCGGSAQMGTETGNPPGINRLELNLEQGAGGIRVVGAPGAIEPPGAAVRVTNLRTGESRETIAFADGSIDVEIAGEPTDEFEVRVSSGGRETSERISFADVARRTELSTLSCTELGDTLSAARIGVLDSLDRSCTYDVDCVAVDLPAGACSHTAAEDTSCRGYSYVSRTAAAELTALAERATVAACDAVLAAGCEPPVPHSCPAIIAEFPVCVSRQCRGIDPNIARCEALGDAGAALSTRFREEADRTCSVDSDCRLTDVRAACVAQCDVSVVTSLSQSGAAELEARIQSEIEGPICGPFFARPCLLPDLDCSSPPGTPEAFCAAGSCSVRYVE